MASKRKFYKTKVTVTVLSEYPLDVGHLSLEKLSYLVDTGDCSGEVSVGESKVMGGKAAAKALVKQGSDPSFFMLDENGNDTEG